MLERLKKVKWEAILVEGDKLSQGRVMGWALFSILIYMWLTAFTVPTSLMTVFLTILGYNFGKKVTDPIKKFLADREAKKLEDEAKAEKQ